VDDDAGIVTALCQTLAGNGYRTRGCASGSEALDALRQADYDVLLCDLMMPQMDGIMLIRAALEIDSNLIGIVLTGQGAIATAVEALRSGAFDYIEKPPRLSVLLPLLSRALQVRRLRNENIQLRQAVAMYELSMTVAFSLDAELILRKVADVALQVSQADEASIVLPTADGKEGIVAAVAGDDREHLVGQTAPFARSVIGWVAQSQAALTLHGAVDDPCFAPVRPRGEIHSALSVPLITGGRLVGVLNLNATRRPRAFTVGDLKAVNILTTIAAPALVTSQLYQQLQHDVTARTQAEAEVRRLNAELEQRVRDRTAQLEAANRELEAFSYSVSHDLRAPLRAIDGFSRILSDYAAHLPEDAQYSLQRLRHNTQRMAQLIDDLLTFSRLSHQPLRKQEVTVREVVHDVLESLQSERNGRSVEYVIGKLPPCQADPVLLRQVYVNLVSNALKFTRPRATARIEIGSQEHEGARVYYVKDNGVGFDMQYADKLFGVFQRLHRLEEYEGTGAGLAIVQRIIQRHGGRIWAEGVVDRGATFLFTLTGRGEEHA
jgi:signal transduction histidine kinase/ActR/RegA family two-component response regulator